MPASGAHTFTIRNFKLENGTVMLEVTIAYETYGTLASVKLARWI